ncbi:calcium-binding protein [Shinella sp. S4-D37]|uniref:EF-hand domain-containing protein n=1 Tax=Shinella sp. S4-D37 TaxID=3161999 RepID=UPI003466D107
MKRKTILTLSAVALTATAAAFAIPALAGGPGPWGCHGMRMGGHGPMGPMGMQALRENPVYKSFDADGNGTVTTTEAEAGIAALHGKHDADGDGKLSATEFEALLAEVSKGFAARPFAMLDADGDKAISAEEMAFPVKMMAHMRAWRDAAPEDGPKP